MDSLRFAITGDWGGQSLLYSMNNKNLSKLTNLDFYILLGDNFYPSGVENEHDPQWQSKFLTSFTLPIPSFAILGNHDYISNPFAQILYTKKRKYWKMPHFYYDLIVNLGKESVHFLFIDTCILDDDITANLLISTDINERSYKNYIQIKEKHQQNHKEWIKKTLKKSTSKWKIVCGHYPLFSLGPHRISESLKEFLCPLFKMYHVDFYLAGHDHNMQHIIEGNTQFIISGAYSSFYPIARCNKEDKNCKFISKIGGFVKFEIRNNMILTEFVGANNDILYTFSCSKL